MDSASQEQTVTSTESFKSGIHLQRQPDGNKQGCSFSNSLSLTEIHVCSALSLFLSLLLMFSPEIFQMNCVRPVKARILSLLLSWHHAAGSPGPPQAANSSCGLLTSQGGSHPLLQPACSTESQSQRQHAAKKNPHPLTRPHTFTAQKQRSLPSLCSVAALRYSIRFFRPIPVS